MRHTNKTVCWAVCIFMHLLGGLFRKLCINACVSPVNPVQPLIWASLVSDWLGTQETGGSLTNAIVKVSIYLVTEQICLHSKRLIRVSEMLRKPNVEDWKHVFIWLWFTGQERRPGNVRERDPTAVHYTLTQTGRGKYRTLLLLHE